MIPNKGNGVIILDRKLYDKAIQETISDTSKFKKLNEDPTLKCKASLERFFRKLKPKNFFNENVYDTLYSSVSILIVPMVLIKYTSFLPVTYFLNFV